MKWQYCIQEDESSLNQLGEEGWELVAVFNTNNRPKFYMKRPCVDMKRIITDLQRKEIYKHHGLEVKV